MTILFLAFAAYALGVWVVWLLPATRVVPVFAETPFHQLLAGLVTAAPLSLIAGSISLSVAWWMVAALAVVGAALLGRDLRRETWRTFRWTRLDWVERCSLAAIGAGLGFAFICAMAPVTAWDAGVAHIALPADYVRNGHIGLIEGNNYSAYPHFMHALYALAYCSGERSVSLVSWSFGAIACGAAYLLGARIDGRRCGLIAAAVLATAPIFVEQAGAPSLDLAFTATVLAALHAMTAWRQERNTSWLVLAGLIAGAGCGIRHTGYLVAVILAGFVLADGTPRRLRSAYVFSFACAAAALPWLMRSAATSGNPFYPFFASLFGPAALPDVDAASILTHSSIQGIGLADFVLFPFNVVLDPLRYGGWTTSPGILILALGIPGLFIGGSEARRLGAFSGAGIACMFFFRRFARYLLPFFAPMMVVAAIAACRAKRLRGPLLAVLLVGYGLGLAPGAAMTAIRVPAAVGLESREDFLTRRVERYPAFAWANEHLESNGVVLTLDPRGYYIDRATFVNFEALKPLVAMDDAERLDWLRDHQIRFILYPEAYVQESPAFRETGVMDVLNAWRADNRHFELIARFELPRPRTDGTETVEIYAVRGFGKQ